MIDPTQTAGQPPAAAPQGTSVVITALPDGTFTVGPDADDQGSGDSGAQPAQDIDSALDMARQMLGGAGAQGGQDGQDADAQAEALFKGGFNSASGRPPMGNN